MENTLIFWSKKHNGGYGDRLVGMSSGITIARILEKSFVSNWEDDYKILCDASDSLIVNIPGNCFQLNLYNQKRNSFLENDNILADFSGKNILFQANQPVDHLLWANPFLKEILAGRSYETESIISYQEIFSKYIPIKSFVKDRIVFSTPTSFDNLIFDCGIQIRCGDTYCMPHNLAEEYIPEAMFPSFTLQIKEYLIGREISGKIFVTSDARIMYEHFRKLSDDRIQFYFIERSEDIHFDFYNSQNKYIGIVADHMSLQNCKRIITGLRSNFGTTAAYCSPICEEMILYSLGKASNAEFRTVNCKEQLVLKEYNWFKQNNV